MTGCDYCEYTGEVCDDCNAAITNCACADAPFYEPQEED